MPMRVEPKSLKESALVSIARNFDYLCYNCRTQAEMRQMVDDDSFLTVDGPFLSMPSSLITDLMTVIEGSSTSFYMQRKHLHLLLLPHLETLKLTPTSAGNNFGLELVQTRCKRIRKLDLSYLSHMSPMVVIRLIPTLEHLMVLNLKKSDIPDQVLGLVGKHCLEIREIDVSMCPITNHGIYTLCYDSEERRTLCKKLVRLNVTGCMVSSEALSFLVLKIPTISELEYENIFRVFGSFGGVGIDLQTILDSTSQIFHLRQLTSMNDNVSSDSAGFTVELCPLASSVTIYNTIIQNEALYKIMNLQNLAHIRLTNNKNRTIDFYDGVLPILTVCGHQLHSLLLSKFTLIDIAAIGDCCPRLKNFAISDIDMFEELPFPKEDAFTEINVLEVWSDQYTESIDSVILRQLLGYCPNIHNLLISGTKALTDKLFTEIWKTNDMNAISRVTIENCPCLSRSTFENLLDTPNKVALLRIWNCFLVSKEDSVYLQNRIESENCDVYLEWFPWLG